MKHKTLKGKISIKQNGDGITVVASDETLDRHGDVLPIEQWDLAKFMLSPRMLVDHNHEVASIVGKWENVRIEGKQLLMDANFHRITELSKAVEEMVKEGFLDTVSVGFIPHGPEGDGQRGSFELIETSWVTVPANPSARVQAALKSIEGKVPTEQDIAKIKDLVGDEPEPIEEEPEEEPEPGADEADLGDFADEDFKKLGIKMCDNIADYQEWQASNDGTKTFAVCTARFMNEIIATNEKLQTLIDAEKEKVEASDDAKLNKLALKEAAKVIQDTLRRLNRRN